MIKNIGKRDWQTVERICVSLPGGVSQCVEVGYVTDLATIPRLMWPIVGHPAEGDFIIPAIIHDKLCDDAWSSGDYSARLYADAVFFYLLSREGVPYWKRAAMYAGVSANRMVCYSWRRIRSLWGAK